MWWAQPVGDDTARTPPLVAHVIYALGTGGLENGLVNIINRTPPDSYRHVIICLTQADEFQNRITVPGVEVIALHKRPGHELGVYWRLWAVLRRLRPAIIHTRNLAALETQVIACLLPGTKRVHGEHGRDVYDLEGQNKKYNLLRKMIRPLVHCYIAVSKDLQHWLLGTVGVNPHKVKQIYNGVDQEKFYPGSGSRSVLAPAEFPADDSLVLGTVGRLAEVKHQCALVQAFELLCQRYPQYHSRLRLVMVGDGPMEAKIRDQVSVSGLSSQVWMTGARDDIPELMRLMDIFVLPSLGEGISNTILEAMAVGLPVIATDVGGNPELIEDGVNGRLVPVGDASALADAIFELLESPALRESMGDKNLKKVAASFCWSKTVDQYLSVYDRLLGLVEVRSVKTRHTTAKGS